MTSLTLKDVDLDLPLGARSLEMLFRGRKPRYRDERLKDGGHTHVKVLRNISLSIKSGDRIGLIGVNGAGKSTLLRVLAGIYAPTRGVCEVEGRTSTLFASAVGMNPNASGRENIFLSGRTLGMSRAQLAACEDDILDFAQLGDFIDLPFRLYSAGMKTRLGFAIATAAQPEILLIDEVFGVGDRTFRKNANARIERMMGHAGILVLATHADQLVEKFCDKVCWLDAGQVRFFGDVDKGLSEYTASGA